MPINRFLVVVELNGGNDGLNTVVPFKQREYQHNRQRVRVNKQDVLKLDGRNRFESCDVGIQAVV